MTAMPVRLPPKGMNFFRPAMAVEVGFRPGYASKAGRSLAGLGADNARDSHGYMGRHYAAHGKRLAGLGDATAQGDAGSMNFWGSIIGAVGSAAGGIASAFAAPANAQAAQANAAAQIAIAQANEQRQQLAAESRNMTLMVAGGVVVAGIAAYVLTR